MPKSLDPSPNSIEPSSQRHSPQPAHWYSRTVLPRRESRIERVRREHAAHLGQRHQCFTCGSIRVTSWFVMACRENSSSHGPVCMNRGEAGGIASFRGSLLTSPFGVASASTPRVQSTRSSPCGRTGCSASPPSSRDNTVLDPYAIGRARGHCRTSTNLPSIAAAAAIAGDTRCVRPL